MTPFFLLMLVLTTILTISLQQSAFEVNSTRNRNLKLLHDGHFKSKNYEQEASALERSDDKTVLSQVKSDARFATEVLERPKGVILAEQNSNIPITPSSEKVDTFQLELPDEDGLYAPENCGTTKLAHENRLRGAPAPPFHKQVYATNISISNDNLGCSVYKNYCTGKPLEIPCCHTLLANMLFDLLDVLDSNSITYTISAGTALGAHRDGHFIAWDTRDVDVKIHPKDHPQAKQLVHQFIKERNLVIRTPGPLRFADDNHVYTRKYHEEYGYPPAGEFCFATPEFDWNFPEFRSIRTLSNRYPYLEVTSDNWPGSIQYVQLGTMAGVHGPRRRVPVAAPGFLIRKYGYGEDALDGPAPHISQEQLDFHGYVYKPRVQKQHRSE